MSDQEFECPNCGALISKTEAECRYCGSRNPHYEKPKTLSNLFGNTTPTTTNTNGSYSNTPVKQGKINIFVFIILLIVFWPAAIIYLIIAASK